MSLDYQLSDQPVLGEWIIQVIAQGQVEEAQFVVEEYYQTRFEVGTRMHFAHSINTVSPRFIDFY